MISLYDEALLSKLESWTSKTNLHIYNVNDSRTLTEIYADTTGDKPLQLPILSLSRNSGYKILNPNKKVLAYDGMLLEANAEKSVSLNAVPIQVEYQIDVWTRYLKEADAYMRNLIFNIINYPTVTISIPYNSGNIEHNSTIRLITGVMDNSNNGRLSIGQFSRLSVGISIDDAYLWDTRIRNVIYIDEESSAE